MEEFLEYPLPKIELSVSKLYIEADGFNEGLFYIKNIGGGNLEVKIISNIKGITIEPNEFKSNFQCVRFYVNTEGYSEGELIKASLIITSNGGEAFMPVVIKVMPRCFETKEGIKLYSLKDFLTYSKKYPIEARRIISSDEFILWAKYAGFEHTEILEAFIKDTNKERLLDNFFILCKLKKRSFIIVKNNKIRLNIGDEDIAEGKIELIRSGSGYFEEDIFCDTECPWLTIKKNKVTSRDFNENTEYVIDYSVNTKLVNESHLIGRVYIGKNNVVEITVIKKPIVKIEISKEGYSFDDEGFLTIHNNSGRDIMAEIAADDAFVKLEAKNYFISGSMERINFKVKFTALQKMQLGIKKRPYIESKIHIKFNLDGRIIKRTKKIVIAEAFY